MDGQGAAATLVPAQALLDPNIQYQFRTENGQGGGVTYRVVQVAAAPEAAEAGGQVVTTAALVGQQVAQAIISSPFAATTANGGSSPTTEGGQFYVMMSPQDVLQTAPRSLAPRAHSFSAKSEGNRTARDERRRATHNEVERRRRDKINNWIVKLSKIIPDCSSDLNKSGQVSRSLLFPPHEALTASSPSAAIVGAPAQQGGHPGQGVRLHPGAAGERRAAPRAAQGE